MERVGRPKEQSEEVFSCVPPLFFSMYLLAYNSWIA